MRCVSDKRPDQLEFVTSESHYGEFDLSEDSLLGMKKAEFAPAHRIAQLPTA